MTPRSRRSAKWKSQLADSILRRPCCCSARRLSRYALREPRFRARGTPSQTNGGACADACCECSVGCVVAAISFERALVRRYKPRPSAAMPRRSDHCRAEPSSPFSTGRCSGGSPRFVLGLTLVTRRCSSCRARETPTTRDALAYRGACRSGRWRRWPGPGHAASDARARPVRPPRCGHLRHLLAAGAWLGALPPLSAHARAR